LINVSMADAGCVAWGVKYRDAFWRPIVAIRNGDSDGNAATVGEMDWSPLGAPRTNPAPGEDVNFTPPFPAYISGHATFGGAAFKSMANFYQSDDINFSIPFDFISEEFNGVSRDIYEAIPELVVSHVRQIRPRHFESFSQASAENAASRIFLGIHWRFDQIQGLSAGNRIADMVFDTKLRARGGGATHVSSTNFAAQVDAYLDGSYTTVFAGTSESVVGTAESIAEEIVEMIVAPGDFRNQMHDGLDPAVELVMTSMMDHSNRFKKLAHRLDRMADSGKHEEAVERLGEKLQDMLFNSDELIEVL
jgi:hypothetical protein